MESFQKLTTVILFLGQKSITESILHLNHMNYLYPKGLI